MESLILEDLKSLGKNFSNKEFKQMIDGGAKSIKYTQLVEWMTKEIQILAGLEEYVNAIISEVDSSSFLMEVSSFLKESGCSYDTLTTGSFEDRLISNDNKLLFLDYLIGELRASRILNANTINKKTNMQVTLIESNTSKCLKEILMTLKFPKPPQDINTASLFNKIHIKLQDLLKTVPPTLIGKSLVCNSYNSEQWKYINNIIELLNEEFNIRRAMLLTRLDVTFQSFKWPDKLKNKKHKLDEVYQVKLNLINKLPNFSTTDFISAREDLAIIEKTSSTLVVQNTNSSINKVMIGQVPDRGGRPNEQQAPPPEMPSWQQRTQSQGGRGSQSNRRGQFNNIKDPGRGNPSTANVYQVTDGFQSISVGNRNENSYQNNRRGRVQGNWNNHSVDFQGSNNGEQCSYNNYDQGNHQNRGFDKSRFQSRGQNKNQSDFQVDNFREQRNYSSYNQGNYQTRGYNNSRFQSTSRQWNSDQQNVYGNTQDQQHDSNVEYGRNDFVDGSRNRGYSKRGRGHNGQTYYNQQRNNQNY